MNVENAALTGGVTGTIVLVAAVVYKFLHHSMCSSNCCGKVVKFKADLSPPRDSGGFPTTEQKPEVVVKN